MTPNFAEQAEKYSEDRANSFGDCWNETDVQNAAVCYLAGCEHGYRVGKQACDCHGDETGQTAYKCVFHAEIDQLKARLAEVTEALEQREGVNAKSLLSQNLDLRARLEECEEALEPLAKATWIPSHSPHAKGLIPLNIEEAKAYFTKHPQDGAKGDL